MDIEEMMIDYILYDAEDNEREVFFGTKNYTLTKNSCREVLNQMLDEEFDRLVELFGFNIDSLKM